MPTMKDREPSPAELFESFFGPSLFKPWARVLLEYADPRPGERVLDLACATGVVARLVAPMVGEHGRVVGLDNNPEMLAVARERAEAEGVDVAWREADAAETGLPDDSFDLALCQQGIQFFPDPVAALREARRVLDDDGGRIVLNVWQPLERQPVYRAIMEAVARHLGEDVTEVATPFMFGGAERLRTVMDRAGFGRVEVHERTLEVEFGEPEKFVALTVFAAAALLPQFGEMEPPEQKALVQAIVRDCEDVLEEHRDGDRIRFPTPNLIGVGYA